MIKRTSNLDKNKTINRRLFILGSAKIGLLGLITSRLYNLQISEKKKYKILSDKNRFREWKTPPKRGVITDFYNNIIADNRRVYQVYLSNVSKSICLSICLLIYLSVYKSKIYPIFLSSSTSIHPYTCVCKSVFPSA